MKTKSSDQYEIKIKKLNAEISSLSENLKSSQKAASNEIQILSDEIKELENAAKNAVSFFELFRSMSIKIIAQEYGWNVTHRDLIDQPFTDHLIDEKINDKIDELMTSAGFYGKPPKSTSRIWNSDKIESAKAAGIVRAIWEAFSKRWISLSPQKLIDLKKLSTTSNVLQIEEFTRVFEYELKYLNNN